MTEARRPVAGPRSNSARGNLALAETRARQGPIMMLDDFQPIQGPHGRRPVAHLSPQRELELLTLKGPVLTDQGMPHLAVLTGLKRLDLKQTAVTDAEVSWLVDLPYLQWLVVRRSQVGEAGLLELKNSRSLIGVPVDGMLFLGGNEDRSREAVSPWHIN